MDTKKVIFFLDILRNNTTGYSDELANLYKKALDENDSVENLKILLEEVSYYGGLGESFYTEGKNLINKLYASPSDALDVLPDIEQCTERINSQIKLSQSVLKSIYPSTENITVIKNKDIITYFEAYKMIANVCVYLFCLYEGIDTGKYLQWNDNGGIRDMANLVNKTYLPLLLSIKRPNESWVIRRRKLGGKALFGGDAFYISYENTKKVNDLCNLLHKEPMGTHAFLNIDAYESQQNDVPFCWGIGNLISFSPADSLLYLQKDIVKTVKAPTKDLFTKKMPTPIKCLEKVSEGKPFCISPEELTKLLNQWVIGKEIEDRKSTHNCLFCNRYVKGNKLICDSHFDSEL